MLNDGPENQGNTTTKSSPDQSSFGVTYGSVPIANLPGVAPEKDLTTEDQGSDYRELYSLRKKLNKKLLTVIGVIILILLLLIGSVWAFSSRKKETPTSSNNQTLSSDGLSLTDPRLDGTGTLDPSRKLEVNSRLVANNSIILTPTNQPDTPQLGQIFLNKNDSKLYFYNGQRFVEIASASTASAAGLQGPAGANGIQGPRGLDGINGSKGDKGDQGDTGAQGPQGPGGVGSCPYGDCVSLQVGSPGTQEVGNLNVSGVIIAGSFSGNGSALTNVNAATLNGQAGSYYTNATNLTSGTVSDARLSPNVTLQGNTFNGMSQLVQTTAGGALPVISGANLTSLNATNISSGTLSDARLSTNVTVQGNTFNGVNQLVQLNGSGFLPALNGSLLTNVDAATLNGQAGSYYTNATNISSGTLNDARLSSNVTLQGNTFNGASQLIQLNASTELPAVSGANLTNLNGSSISSGTVSNTYLTGSGALTVTAGNGLINGGSVALGSSVTLNVGAGDGITVNANDIAVDSTVCRTSNNCTAVGAASGDLTGNYPGPTIASLQGKTLTVSGTPTTGAVLQYNGSAFVDGLIANGNLAAGTFTNITGVGALTAGSIGGSFGNINIGSNTFTGNGSGLTNVDAATLGGQAGSYYTNATNISSGTLSDLRLSSNVTLQGNTFNGASQLVQTTVGGALPTLSGINLTNLNASNIASGTLNDLRLSSNVTLQGNTFNGISQLVQLDGSGYLPALNASLLTAINASNIASGTLNDSRLSANVALLNQANTFTALLTANAGITLLTGQNLTINGDVISDLTGTGLTVSGGALTVDATSGTGFFRNGGNSFGAAATLGTNDVNVLNLETNNTNRFQISSNSSKLTGQGNTEIDSTGALFIGGNGSNGIAIGNSSVSSNQIAIGGSPNVDYINLQSTSSIAVIANDTTVVSQNDSATAFQVQNSLASPLFNVDASTASTLVYSPYDSVTAFQVQDSSNRSLLNVDAATGSTTIASGGSTTTLQVLNSSGDQLMNVDTTNVVNNLITNPSFEVDATGWFAGSADITQAYTGRASLRVDGFDPGDGTGFDVALASDTMYTLSFYAKAGSENNEAFTSMYAGHFDGTTDVDCLTNQSVSSWGWTRYSCTFTTGTTSGTPSIYMRQNDSTDRAFYIDGVQLLNNTLPSNIISGTNSTFETGVGSWGGYSGSAPTQSSTQAHMGTYSGRMITTGAGGENGISYGVSGLVSPSTTYTIKAYIKADASSTQSTYQLGHTLDSGQVITSRNGCNVVTAVSSEWRVLTCTFTTASSLRGAPYITITQTNNTSIATTVYIDSVSMYAGTDVGGTDQGFTLGGISLNGAINSPVLFQNTSNSTTAFQIQGANSSTSLLTADTINNRIAIGKNTANYTLDVEGTINSSVSVITPLVTSAAGTALTVDSGTTGALNIGSGANAKTITIGNATGATSVVVNCGTGACSFGANATAHTTTIGSLTGASTTTIQGGTGGVSLGSSGVANTIQIGNTTGAVSQTINIGNNATASSTSNVNIGSSVAGTTAITGTTTVTGRTSGSATALTVNNSTSTGSIFVAQDNGTAVMTIANNGGATFKTVTNTANAFKTTNSNNDILLNVGTAQSISDYTNIINNSSFESGSTGWTGKAGGSTGSGTGGGSVTGVSYMTISMDAAGEGAYYPVTLSANTDYTLSVYARTNWGAMNTLVMGHQDQFGTDIDDCVLSSETIDTDWHRVSCTFTTGSTISSSNVYIRQSDGTNRTVDFDAVQLQASAGLNAYNMGEVYFNAPINQNLIVTGNGYTGGTDLTFQVQDSTGALQFGVSGAGQVTVENDLAVNGGDFTSTATTFNFLQSTVDTLNIGGAVGSGGLNLAGGSGSTGCTIQGAVGSLTCSGNIVSTATSGLQGWWSRTGTTLQPANSGDNITTSGNISTTGTGTITSAGNFIANGTSLFQNQTNSTTALQVQNSSGEQLITVDTLTTNNLMSNGNFEANTTGWAAKGGATLSQTTSQHALGTGSMQVTTTAAANDGAKYNYALASQTSYTITAYVKATTNTAATTTISLGFTQDGSTDTNCATNQTILGSGWSKLTCNFTTANVTGTNNIYIKQSDATSRTIYIDSVQLESRSTLNANTDFEVNSSGWSSYSAAAIAQSALQAYIGTGSLQVVTSSTSGSLEGALTTDSFQPNTTYSASYMIWLDSASAPSKSFSIIKRADPSDNAVGSTCGSSLVVTADTWTNISCTFTTRSTVVSNPFIGVVTTDSGDTVTQYTFYIDTAVVAPIKHSSNDIGRININAAISSPLTLLGPDSTTAFQIQSLNSSTNLFTADTANNRIGIGTNTPTHNLTVVGDALFRLGTSTTGSSVFDTFNIQTTTGANAFSVNNSRAVVIGVNSGTTNASLSTYGSGLFKTMTNSSAAFRIQDAAGNNVVNVSTSTGQKALTVGSNNAAGELIIVDNNSTPVFEIDSTTGSATLSATLNSYDFLDETATPVLGICSSGVTIGGAGSCTGSYPLDVWGDINVSSGSVYRINGTDINTAGTLSNVAYLNGTGPQTFTGNNSFTGTILHQNSSNSTTAFQIQNAAGTSNLFVADTTNTRIGVGAAPANSLLSIGTNTTTAAGGVTFGTDTALYRYAADVLATDGSFFANGGNFFATTAFTGLSFSSATNSGIYNTGANGTGIISIDNGTAGVPVVGIAQGGATTFRNNTDSTAAFQIQNSSSTPLLVADTTNSRLYVGNPTADSTGAILVLDTKNTSGDPTGVDGAMYYNSDSKSFRCYSNSTWRSCMSGVVFANTSLPGGNTVASTAAETDFASNYSIPANDCQPGRVYKVTAQGVWSNGGGGTNTLRWKVKLGSTTIGDTNAQTVATGVTDESWRVEFNFICQTTGGSGTIEAQGYLTGWTSAVNSANWTMKNTGTVTIDTTTSQTLQMSVQHDSSSAGKSATLRQFIVEASGP